MNPFKNSKIKAKIDISDLFELKSKGIFIIVLLFPFALLLSAINTVYHNTLDIANGLTMLICFLSCAILIGIPLLKKGIAVDYQKNCYNYLILGNTIIYKYNFIPNDYNKLIITEKEFSKFNTNINIDNTTPTFNYPIYKFVAQKNNSQKNIFTVDNQVEKNRLKDFLEKETNLRYGTSKQLD